MRQIQDLWENLDAGLKRNLFLGVGVFVLVLIVWAFVSGGEKLDTLGLKHKGTQKHVTVFSDNNIKKLSMERMLAKINIMERKITDSHKKLSRLQEELKRTKKHAPVQQSGSGLSKRDVMSIVDDAIKKTKDELRDDAEKAKPVTSEDDRPNKAEDQNKKENNKRRYESQNDGSSSVKNGHAVTAMPDDVETNPFDQGSNNGNSGKSQLSKDGHQQQHNNNVNHSTSSGEIRTIEATGNVKDENGLASDGGRAPYVPMGSIITGVLLNGLDAGTGQGARKNPYPVLVRVKKEAILPNRRLADVRECFILASGFGELSSERVYLRSEGISCINNDGGVVEVEAKLYAVGEDGKAGLRGRLVNKQGQLLAKSLLAGVLSGFSSVFSQQAIPTLSTTATGVAPFQRVLSKESVQSGLVKGASSALDRLAQFYIDAADQIFPVLEIDAERRITFVTTKGFNMASTTNRAKQPENQVVSP